LDTRGRPAPAGMGRPVRAPSRLRNSRAEGSLPPPARTRPDRVPLRPGRQRSRDQAVRGDRHGAPARLPLAPLLSVDALLPPRHGFAGSNRRDIASSAIPGEGLTPEGEAQARALGGLLAGTGISLAGATELERTQETLRLALDGTPVPTILVPEL